MREKHVFYFVHGFLAGGICLILAGSAEWEVAVAGALVLACLLSASLLLDLLEKVKWLSLFLLLVAAAGALLLFGSQMFPFAAVLIVWATEKLAAGQAHTILAFTALFLCGLVLWPPLETVLVGILCVVPLWVFSWILRRLAASHDVIAAKSEENDTLREQLAGQRRMVQTMEHAARLNERNRLAARIHDEIGHGVSGSILLLEGAMLNIEKHPDKTLGAVSTATENLREAVDDIRAALREERSTRSESGLAEIAAALSRFEAEHPRIRAELLTEGDLTQISPLVWLCIRENLTEMLTNLMKHSSASHFSFSITVQKKLIEVCYKDNGNTGQFKPGMGLAAMEERCALCHGRCFFHGSARGFAITMTFTQPRETLAPTGGDTL